MEENSNLDPLARLRATMKEWNDKLKADNERQRAEKNARRWKAERDPIEYENQKIKQRLEYAQSKPDPVRPYLKISATTKADYSKKQKVRDAERQKKNYEGMTAAERQGKSDLTAERAWIERRRQKLVAEDVIQAELITYREKRVAKRILKSQDELDDAAMRADPSFGIF